MLYKSANEWMNNKWHMYKGKTPEIFCFSRNLYDTQFMVSSSQFGKLENSIYMHSVLVHVRNLADPHNPAHKMCRTCGCVQETEDNSEKIRSWLNVLRYKNWRILWKNHAFAELSLSLLFAHIHNVIAMNDNTFICISEMYAI